MRDVMSVADFEHADFALAAASARSASEPTLSALRLLCVLFAHGGAPLTAVRLDGVRALLRTLDTLTKAEQAKYMHASDSTSLWAYGRFVASLIEAEPRMRRASPPRPLVTAEGRRLHVVGDSHTLSYAWRSIRVGKEQCVLTPCLIPGLKAFHAVAAVAEQGGVHTAKGERGRLLCKALARIAAADGSGERLDIIVSAGEIDTRDGIASAVRKGRYATIEDGAAATAALFVAALRELAPRNTRIVLLPVPPHARRAKKAGRYRARAKRRECTAYFNAALRGAVGDDDPKLLFLDAFRDLVDPATTEAVLDPALRCDGSHTNALVVSILERHLRNSTKNTQRI
jgi:hypothetical protein